MKMKKLAAALAVMVTVSAVAPYASYAVINEDELPVCISSNKNSKEYKAFENTVPELKTVQYDDYYEYCYYRGYETLMWEPVDNALFYCIYRKEPGGKFKKEAVTFDTSYYAEVNYEVNTKIQYCIKAVTYTTTDRVVYSKPSNVLTFEKREYVYDYVDEDEEAAAYDAAGTADGVQNTVSYSEEEEYEEDYDYGDEDYDEDDYSDEDYDYEEDEPQNDEEYSHSDESGFKNASTDPVSTFSSDVDTASYTNIRRLINSGSRVPEDAMRIEEMLNYFDYNYAKPTGDVPFRLTYELSDCPWNKDAKLMSLGIQAKDIAADKTPYSNYVFLVDVSGSMYSEDKLELVKKSINLLSKSLTEKDRLSIVIYSGEEKVVLAGVKGNQKNVVKAITECMEADGCTNGEDAINTAYELAEHYYIKGGNNRVIIATDGDFNVGISDEDELKEFITEKRKSGVYLSVLGYGTENIKDNKMEGIADCGNGTYHYIDCAEEACKVLVEEKNSTLVTVADDVKIQVEFNPANVKSYRLIGYDNRRMNNEDFDNSDKDAGDVGAGDSVTVLYEIIENDGTGNNLIYQKPTNKSDDWCTVKLAYKRPGEAKQRKGSISINGSLYSPYKEMSARMKFQCAVAEFGMLLKDSDYKGNSSIKNINKLLNDMDPKDKTGNIGYKSDFIGLVDKYTYL